MLLTIKITMLLNREKKIDTFANYILMSIDLKSTPSTQINSFNWMNRGCMCWTRSSICPSATCWPALSITSAARPTMIGIANFRLFSHPFGDVKPYSLSFRWYIINYCLDCRTSTGIKLGDLFMSYKSMFQDVRTAVDHVHLKVGSIRSFPS